MSIKAFELKRAGTWEGDVAGRLTLDYEGRFLRRKRLVTETGEAVLVDLAETVSVDAGDAFLAEDGRLFVIDAAPEPLLQIQGALVRLVWHIGNRHTPCQVAADHVLIRHDHVLAKMLEGLGAEVTPVMAPFRPEGGAYGHGRTHGHSHGSEDPHHHHHHDHSHDHGHDH